MVEDKGTAALLLLYTGRRNTVDPSGSQGLGWVGLAAGAVVGWRYVVKFLKTVLCTGAP